MYVHVVLFRWQDTAAPEAIDDVMQMLLALKGKVPGLVESTGGANESTRAQGYSHGAVMKFETREALEAYATHPEHQKVLQRLALLMAQVVVLDYPE